MLEDENQAAGDENRQVAQQAPQLEGKNQEAARGKRQTGQDKSQLGE